MKRIIIGLLAVVLLSSGCAYHKQTLLKVKGEEVKVPLGPLEGITGKGLKATLYRNVSISFPSKDAIKEFLGIKSTDTKDGEATTDSVDVTK